MTGKGEIGSHECHRGFLLGIDFGGTKMALASATRAGEIIERRRLPTNAGGGARQAVERALQVAKELAVSATDLYGELCGVGVSSMGITFDDHVELAPNVPGWSQLSLPQAIGDVFPSVGARIENDVKAAAWAELKWGELQSCNYGLFVNLGTGIAATAVLGGRIVRGAHLAAGEIGYSLRTPSEEKGAADGVAPLEEAVGGVGLARRMTEEFGPSTDVGLIFEKAVKNPDSAVLIDETANEIACHLTNLTIALDPERVVLGGGMLAAKTLIFPRLEAYLAKFVPYPPELAEARYSQDGALMGAVAIAGEPVEAL